MTSFNMNRAFQSKSKRVSINSCFLFVVVSHRWPAELLSAAVVQQFFLSSIPLSQRHNQHCSWHSYGQQQDSWNQLELAFTWHGAAAWLCSESPIPMHHSPVLPKLCHISQLWQFINHGTEAPILSMKQITGFLMVWVCTLKLHSI